VVETGACSTLATEESEVAALKRERENKDKELPRGDT